MSNSDVSGLRAALERTLARADRYEAEFSACKALLIAEQKRAERAEAERADARALALREAAEMVNGLRTRFPAKDRLDIDADYVVDRIRALAALPVEPARRQVTDNANALGAPAARSPAMPEEGT